jgi:hypothetical protein
VRKDGGGHQCGRASGESRDLTGAEIRLKVSKQILI